MSTLFDLKHYTLHNIPNYRLDFIKVKIKYFMKEFDIKSWPIDCVKIIKDISELSEIQLQIGCASKVSNSFDAIAIYHPSKAVYQIIVNRNKIKYPFKCSKDRRLNFTLAHELGHIFLEHLTIPDELKTAQEKYIEELEADEFAAMLLMPEKLILHTRFLSIAHVADTFNVSTQAAWKRVNNLKILNSLKSSLQSDDDFYVEEPYYFD